MEGWGGGAGGDADATLAALTGAKDSSRLPGRDELKRWGNALGAGLSGKVGRAACFRWVLQRPAGCSGRPSRSSSASPPFIFARGRAATVVNVILNREELGMRLGF